MLQLYVTTAYSTLIFPTLAVVIICAKFPIVLYSRPKLISFQDIFPYLLLLALSYF